MQESTRDTDKAQTDMTSTGDQDAPITRRIALKPGFTTRQVGQKIFVLSRDSRMHILENRTASFLWERLQSAGAGGKSQGELIKDLTDHFEVVPDVALRDIEMFLQQLISAGIAAVCESPGP